jgi:SAM-dependent methyltransferase
MTTPICRICRGAELVPILSLGEMPLANALVSADHLHCPETRVPLELVLCRTCSLVQITETVPPERLFRDYVYFSSLSDSFVAHTARLVNRMLVERRLGRGSRVVEIASNDGYLLQYYLARGVQVLGIEPAANVAEVAQRDRGIPTITEFFTPELADRLRRDGVTADVIHAHNVLAHVPDPVAFVAGLKRLLEDGGVAVFEVPYLEDLIDRLEFDTIYHEHLCYFSLTALVRLFDTAGLQVADVERIPVHGGSLRLFVTHPDAGEPSERVEDLVQHECSWGVSRLETYLSFATRIEELRGSARELLMNLHASGNRIAGYGAAAKGTILLNYLGLDSGVVEFVVDRSSYKQGRFVPGVRIPILSPDMLVERMPDYVLLLAWNLADEVLAQQADYRARGGRFIVPLPSVQVL